MNLNSDLQITLLTNFSFLTKSFTFDSCHFKQVFNLLTNAMKKNLLFLILSFLSFNSFSQSENDNKVTFDSTTYIGTAIINVPGVSKDEMYKSVKLWIAAAYRSGKTVTDLDDKTGDVFTIILKASHFTTVKYFGQVNNDENNYTSTIKIKDNKVKIEISDWFNVGNHGYGSGLFTNSKAGYGVPKTVWEQNKDQVKQYVKDLLNSFSNEMLNPAKSNDDF